jgi:SAM-dependent methyltransferase
MGISRGGIKLMMREGKHEKYSGRILTAGRQEIFATVSDLARWAREMEYPLTAGWDDRRGEKQDPSKNDEKLTDGVLFSALGFNELESMDYSDYESCTVVHDLNKDVPARYHDRYDLIFDGGTSEHIFNLPKVLENYNRMLKPGGRMVHALPSSNHVDHGFYMFSPTLLSDYYSSNNWYIKDSLFIQYSPRHDRELWNIYDYKPGCLDRLSFGGLGRGMYGIFFVARKTKEASFDADVQQGSYRRIWSLPEQTHGGSKDRSFLRKLSNVLPPVLKEVVRPWYQAILARVPLKFHLKLVARY